MLTAAGGISGSGLEAALAQSRRAGNVLAEVDLADNLLHLSALCRSHIHLARNVGRKGVRVERPLEARHFDVACRGVPLRVWKVR